MTTWVYFATAERASRRDTLNAVINDQFLWRSAYNSKGARVANVRHIAPGDRILVAWRAPKARTTAYLLAVVAEPLAPVELGMAIDRVSGPSAEAIIKAGYPAQPDASVEGFRLDEVQECWLELLGVYPGRNAIHKLAEADLARLSEGRPIPQDVLAEPAPAAATEPAPAASAPLPQPAPSRTLTVDRLHLTADSDDRAFDVYVMVDWSSSSKPTTGNDSIWIAEGAWHGRTFSADAPVNVKTRVAAVDLLRDRLRRWRDEGRRMLVGLDFAFGYPAGFARALGLDTSRGAWRAVHEHIAANVTDAPTNAHNRDAFASDCNRRIGAPGPFWGCGKAAITSDLTQHRVGVFSWPHRGLDEWRLTEREARRRTTTQSVWKLNCGVSVGGQTILGIKHLHELARDVDGRIWPFAGWGVPDDPGVWFAEIFPSLVTYPEWSADYAATRDRTQVQSCVRRAAERDGRGELAGDLARSARLDESAASLVEGEEGWILWVA